MLTGSKVMTGTITRALYTVIVLCMVLSVLAYLITGCYGAQSTSAGGDDTGGHAAVVPAANTSGPFPIVSPNTIHDMLRGAKQASSLLSRDGSDFLADYHQRANPADASAIFGPAWADGHSGFDTVAFAVYRFDLTARTGKLGVHTQWTQGLPDKTLLWLGLSNWERDRWDWNCGAPSGELDAGTAGMARYKRAETGEIYVAVVVLGQSAAKLSKVWLTCSQRGDWWMDGRNATHASCSPFVGPDSPTIKWQVRLGSNTNSCSAVYNANGTIFVGACGGSGDVHSTLYALNPDGAQEWALPLPANSTSTGYSPAIDEDGTIYYSVPYTSLYAVGQDGNQLWSFNGHGCIGSAPAIGDGGVIFVLSATGVGPMQYLHAVDRNGNQLWEHYFAGATATAPAVAADGTVYIGNSDSRLYALKSDGSTLWTYEATGGISTGPVVGGNGAIYFASSEPKLYALNTGGSLVWSVQLESNVLRPMALGPDGSIYAGVGNNVNAYDTAGALRWSYYVAGVGNLSVDANSTVYVGSDNARLYALTPDGALKWWLLTSSALASIPAIGEDGTVFTIDTDGIFYAIGPGSEQAEYTASGYVKDEHGAGIAGVAVTITGEEPVVTDGSGFWNKSGLTTGTYLVSPSKDGYQFDPLLDIVTIDGADASVADFNGNPLAPPVWPMWGANRAHTHCSPYAGPPEATLKWSFWLEQQSFVSEPSIGGDGVVYMQSATGTLYAFNPDGTQRWHYDTGFSSSASPAIAADGTVYTNNTSAPSLYQILALTPGGVFKWSYSPWGVNGTPVLSADGLVIHATDSRSMVALNPDGTVNWLCDLGNSEAPAIGEDGAIYVLNSDIYSAYYHCFIALNPDGSFKWASKKYSQPGNSPVVGNDGTVYCSTTSMLIALQPDGTEKWTYDLDAPASEPAISADGGIYFVKSSLVDLSKNKLVALNTDGTLKWEYYADGYRFSSPPTVDAGGTIYTGVGGLGALHAVNPDGALKWSYDTLADIGPVSIGEDGTLYFGNVGGYVYSLGPGAG